MSPPDPQMIQLAGDLLQALVQALALTTLDPRQRSLVATALGARTGIEVAQLEHLVDFALANPSRGPVSQEEQAVYRAHFGEARARELDDSEGEGLGLEEFAARYGATDSVLLLEILLQLSGGAPPMALVGAAATRLGIDPLVLAALTDKHGQQDPSESRHPIGSKRKLTIGRAAGSDIQLADPAVADNHAELVRAAGQWRVTACTARPVLVDGAAVRSAPVVVGSQIRIGAYLLHFEGDAVRVQAERSFTALSVRGLSRQHGGLTLLDQLSFTVLAGEVVAIVGPSGCGKTTLLSAISGIAPADQGEVLFEGQDLHQLLARDPSLMGVVPQDDIVLPELTVAESLTFSGLLRSPSGVGKADVQAEVDRVLGELGIEHIRDSRIGSALQRGISGGQRKRVNLGQELMTRSTRLLFLDEPTSGLDPAAAQDIARLARRLADLGRIVFLVTHDLSPQFIAQVDHLMVLVPGGRLAWFGPPAEALAWFGAPTLDAIFDRLGDRTPARWGEKFRESEAARKYVAARESLVQAQDRQPSRPPQPRSGWRNLAALTARYAKVKARDRTGLLVFGAQPPLLALVMWLVFPRPTTQLIFMLALSVLWFGMSAGVREFIVDRVTWRQERRAGLGVLPYLLSKVTVLSLIVAVQCLALTGLVYVSVGLGANGFSLAALAGLSTLVGLAGLSLGLVVSATWRSSEAAVGSLILLLVPQIAFSGIMAPISEMALPARALTWITIQRYALHAALKCGEILDYMRLGKWYQRPVSGDLFLLGLRPPGEGEPGLSLPVLALALGGFALVQFILAGVLVWRRDRPKGAPRGI